MSEFLGKKGQILEADITVRSYVWRPHWGPGPKLFLLEDVNGNLLTIHTTVELKVGQKWVIDGTVKRHQFFRGQKQTLLRNWALGLSPSTGRTNAS